MVKDICSLKNVPLTDKNLAATARDNWKYVTRQALLGCPGSTARFWSWNYIGPFSVNCILLVYWLFGGQSISIKSILYTAPQKASILFIEKGPL